MKASYVPEIMDEMEETMGNRNPNAQVIIVGAGVSGMAAGIYARRAGFAVTIFEQHTIAGGLSTAWKRQGYLFEGGMHWLSGSSDALPLHNIWKETGTLQANNPIFVKDPFYTLINGKRTLHLYRDVERLMAALIEYAPEDRKAIQTLCRDIRRFRGVHLLVGDIPFLKAERPCRPSFRELTAMLPALPRLSSLTKRSAIDYINSFQNKDIRHLLSSVVGLRYNALSLVYTLASFATGDCGYPEGGSLRMTQNMADTFTELGGKIHFKTPVERVVSENGKVTGIVANGTEIPADAVIVTQDALKAVDTLFCPPLNEKWTQKMRNDIVTEQTMFIALGVKADLKDLPRGIIFPLDEPFAAGGLEFNELRINNYARYPDHAPAGCTALTCLLIGPSYAYWKAAKEDGSYRQKKQALIERFITRLSDFIPAIQDVVAVSDLATPLTYERYCGSAEGSWMSVWKAGGKAFEFPAKSKSIAGLYFAGQRMMMPGGLPIAVYSGRKAAQYLCRDWGVPFV